MSAVLLVGAVLSACSEAPSRDEAAREAVAPAAVQARRSAQAMIDTALSELVRLAPALSQVETSTLDICHAGDTNGFFPHDDYRLECHWHETRYLAADGDLAAVLQQTDAAAKQAGCIPGSPTDMDDVRAYLAHGGPGDDGQQLPTPRLSYTLPGSSMPLEVGWSAATDHFEPSNKPGLTWPTVYVEQHRVDVDALWTGPLRGRQHLIRLSTSVTYHTIPWPD